MPSINYTVSVSGGGGNINQQVTRTGDGSTVKAVSLPVGIAGTLSTRTDNTNGVLTVAALGGITTSNTIDIYWTGGRRYGCTVSSTTSTTITFTGGSGANLPSATTAIVVSAQVALRFQLKPSGVVFFAVEQGYAVAETASSHVDFQDSSNAEVLSMDLAPNTPQVCDVYGGTANIFSGNTVLRAMASNGSATNVATLNITLIENSTQ